MTTPAFIDLLAKPRAAALKLAPQLSLEPDLVNEGFGIIANVFGENWLREVSQPRRVSPLPFARHPLGTCILTPGETQIIKLLELAEYLKFAADSPAFADLVRGLRDNFASTRLQLAFGFRFGRAGGTEVRFEPPAADGRHADVYFELPEGAFLVECTIPRRQTVGESSDEMTRISQGAIKAAQSAPPTSIAIRLKSEPTAVIRKGTLTAVRELLDQLYAPGDVDLGTALIEETAEAIISVGRTEAAEPGEDSKLVLHWRFPDQGEPTMFNRVGFAPERVLREVTPSLSYPTGTHVAIWLPDDAMAARSLEQDLTEPLARLGKKLKRKLGQTRGDAGRVLIAQSWIAGQLGRAEAGDVERLRHRLFEQHEGVAGVLLVLRGWDWDRSRYRYQIRSLLPERGAVPESFVEALATHEAEDAVPSRVMASTG